ncbi:hypothetical protein J2X76_004605 [Neorhizobium sp. 2083]|nr:hypothetical protein [Neorhizobium sp. 2083]
MIVLPVATPLCPAGHLPLKGGDRPVALIPSIIPGLAVSRRPLAVILGLDPRIHASAFGQPDPIDAFPHEKWVLGSGPRMTGTELEETPGRAERGKPRTRSARR